VFDVVLDLLPQRFIVQESILDLEVKEQAEFLIKGENQLRLMLIIGPFILESGFVTDEFEVSRSALLN
jgi:hypothetical protein